MVADFFQDQWKKKKQTKEQAAAARKAKLDPDSAKTAKDIMDERARKRKAEELEDLGSDIEGVEKEVPREGLKQPQNKKAKKQKVSESTDTSKKPAAEATPQKQQLSKAEIKQIQKEKKEQMKAKVAKKAEKKAEKKVKASKPVSEETKDAEEEDGDWADAATEDLPTGEMGELEVDGLEEVEKDASAPTSPSPPSPTFDNADSNTEPSANTSTSSVIPPATAPKNIGTRTDPAILQARLAVRLQELRAARNADGLNGHPARNRQELLESRRKKEEQRRAHKKELRNKARLDEDARREAALASARDSPASSMMSPRIHSPDHNFSFGRVAFADGQTMTDDLSSIREAPKKRGPQDAATALAATEKKRLRIAGLDDEKRADIEEKDLWLNAKKRAHGEKVRDDTSLLKKTLKRKEKMKKKSEGEWKERKDGVAKSQAMKQKTREANLKKRRDEKGSKGKGSKGKKAGSGKPKVKSRPGFEGSFGSGKRK